MPVSSTGGWAIRFVPLFFSILFSVTSKISSFAILSNLLHTQLGCSECSLLSLDQLVINNYFFNIHNPVILGVFDI
jgi:hypothetical protein